MLVGAGGLVALRGPAGPVEGLRILNAHEYRTVAALARTHLPRGGPYEIGADDVELARAVDAFLADEPEENARDLRRALFLFEFGPVLFDGHTATFSNLPEAARLAHWEGWMSSPLLFRRQAAVALRKLLGTVFFDQEAVWPHIGYPGPSFGGGR